MNSAAWQAALIVSLSAIAGGCGRSPTPIPVSPKPAANPVVKTADQQAQLATDSASAQQAKDATAEPQPAGQADASATAADTAEASAQPPPPTFATERVLLLAPRNPLIVEFQLSIDGLPHTQAMERLVEEVLKVADTDGDGRPTWKEVTESKRFKYGQYGNLAINNENDYKQVIEMYDADRDGTVDASELPRFLTRNAGSARPFSVRGLADFRKTGRDWPLWAILDANDDGAITADERAAAPGRLLSRDTDDDEIVLRGDVNPRVPTEPAMMTARRRGSQTAVRLLGPYADWDSVKGSLEGNYAGDRYVRADTFPLTPELFAQLDKNADGKLVKAEYQGLNDVPPHVVLAVSFGLPKAPAVDSTTKSETTREGEATRESEAPAETKESTEKAADSPDQADDKPPAPPPVPTIRLVSIAPHLADGQVSPTEQPGRITLRVGGMPITFYLNDTVAGAEFDAQARQILMGLDADKNGYLEEKELPPGAAGPLGQFAAVDADENGKVYPDEIAQFLKQQQAGLRAQIHLLAADNDDALFAALDGDHDQRLDAREMEAIDQRLLALDANGDGEITANEVPVSLIVGLARGNLQNLDGLFQPPPTIARPPAEGTPRWFTAMDGNGDGAISRREFLGPAEKFAAIDTNGDSLIDAVEAKAIAKGASEPASGN